MLLEGGPAGSGAGRPTTAAMASEMDTIHEPPRHLYDGYSHLNPRAGILVTAWITSSDSSDDAER